MKRGVSSVVSVYRAYREQIWYLIVGVLTTAVDFAVYYLLSYWTAMHYLLIYWIAWTAAVLFAFPLNRTVVFQNRESGIFRLFVQFVSSRAATLLIGEGLLFLLVTVCGLSDTWMKPVVQALIVILNYVFSRLFVFRKM